MLDQIRTHSASWGVKIAFGIIILVFVFWGVGSYNNSGPGAVATVNGKPIQMRDFQREVTAEYERLRAMMPDVSQEDLKQLRIPEQVLGRLITRALVEQEAQRLGVTVTPREYAAYLRRQMGFQENGAFSQKKYEDFVASQGKNISDFETEFMREMLLEKMQASIAAAASITPDEARKRVGFEMERRIMSYVLFATEDYSKGITISEEDISKYYDGNQAQFARPAAVAVAYLDLTPAAIAHTMTVSDEEVEKAFNAGPLRFNTRQVILFIPDNADEAAVTAMETKLEALAAELRAGGDFAEAVKPLAEEYPDARMGESGMMEARRMPAEMLGALDGLRKNEIAPVVRMGHALALVQLLETDPDWSLPEAEIKDILRRELAEEKAAFAFHDVQLQAEDLLATGKPLAEIAKELQVAVKTTTLVPRDELLQILGLRRPSQISLFEGEKGTLINAILETQEGFAIAEITDIRPAGVIPLDEVSELVRGILTQRAAEKKAEEAARAVIAEFGKDIPADYRDKLITSEPFNRQGNIPGLGFAKALTDAVFSAPLDQWLKEPFATPKGVVIAMPVENLPLSDEEWTKVEGQAMDLILQSKRSQLLNAFITELHKRAEIKVLNPQIFEQ